MRTFITTLICVTFTHFTTAQMLDNQIKTVAHDIAAKAVKRKKIRVAIADFVNNSGETDAITQYATKQFEAELINSDFELEVIDRKHIQQLLSDNKLQSQGLIDESTAKSSVSFIKVDGWIFGELISIDDGIKLTTKIIDVNTSVIFASASSDLIRDNAIVKLKEASDEQAGRKECQKNNSGDYCFKNNAGRDITVKVSSEGKFSVGTNCFPPRCHEANIDPGQSQCFHDLPAGKYYYTVYIKALPNYMNYEYEFKARAQGDILIQRCKTSEITIR